ncbi:MAG: class I SAM-dependent methyltransferase [Magnetococcales bacterium]|nr:class I SAM-dependent methyltransferase [Magnetococcales bacterium]
MLEYVTMRLIRKFLVPHALLRRLRRGVPGYFQPTLAQFEPEARLDAFWDHFAEQGVSTRDCTFLELGSGAGNGLGYALVARGAGRCFCFEPYEPFRPERDQLLRQRVGEETACRVRRVTRLEEVPPRSVERVVSTSVLEHVRDFPALLTALEPLLAPEAIMLHVVDYRDHFFKYPLHFLQFSDAVWQRFLDPGNMPRPRIRDHLEGFAAHGFQVEILKKVVDREAFAPLRHRVHPRFARYSEEDLATTWAWLWVTRA